jgi:hypothetical protein
MYFFLMFILFSCITVNEAKLFFFELFKGNCIYISSTVVRDQLIPELGHWDALLKISDSYIAIESVKNYPTRNGILSLTKLHSEFFSLF